MAKDKKKEKPESQDEGQQPEADNTPAPQEHADYLTESDMKLGSCKVGCAGEHLTVQVDPDNPIAAKLVGRAVSLVVHFVSE